jgi:hypothetical protein
VVIPSTVEDVNRGGSPDDDAALIGQRRAHRTPLLVSGTATFLKALRWMAESTVLEELQIQGRMTKEALSIIHEALQRDFVALTRLQLTVHADELEYAQSIVDAAKLRSYSSLKQGVSIFIDEL